jgi:hypothetical protein
MNVLGHVFSRWVVRLLLAGAAAGAVAAWKRRQPPPPRRARRVRIEPCPLPEARDVPWGADHP